jgi:ABC-type multidrug transport system fused ATPase/permease subunit
MKSANSLSLQVLFRSVRARRLRLGSAVALALVAAATGIISPLLVARLITALGAHTGLTGTVIWLAITVVAGALAGGWSAYLLSTVGERAVADVRVALVRHVVRLPVATVRRIGSGELLSRIGNDAAQLRSITDTAVTGLPVAALMVTAYLITMGLLDWLLLVVVLATFALASIAIKAFLAGMRKGTQVQQAALGRLAQTAQSVFGAITTVKAFRAERRALRPIEEQTDAAASAAIRTARSQAAISPLMGLGQQFAIVAVLAVGGYQLTNGSLTAAHFIAFLMFLFQLVNPLMTLAQGAGRIQLGIAAAARMDAVLGQPVEPAGADDVPAPLRRHGPALEIHDVDVRLADNTALDGLSVEVPRVGLVGVVGPSGAGKSTLLNLIERFVDAERGSVELFGRDLADWPLAEVRRRIALVEQGTSVLGATVRDNLILGLDREPSDEQLWAALDRLDLAAAIDATPQGLDTVLGEALQLSGGELQRLAITRALLTDADVVLLDEPSSHLDGVNEARLVELLHDLSHDRAVVVVAHRLSTVRDARSIVVMDAGHVVAVGNHVKLLATCPTYQGLAFSQRAGSGAGVIVSEPELEREGA